MAFYWYRTEMAFISTVSKWLFIQLQTNIPASPPLCDWAKQNAPNLSSSEFLAAPGLYGTDAQKV